MSNPPSKTVSSNQPSRPEKPRTLLQAFLDANGLTSAQLEAEAKISRQTMTKIRRGRNVRQATMLRILAALRRLTGRKVEMHEIFNLDPDKIGDRTQT